VQTEQQQRGGFAEHLVKKTVDARLMASHLSTPSMRVEAEADLKTGVVRPSLVHPAGTPVVELDQFLHRLSLKCDRDWVRVAKRLHKRGFAKLDADEKNTAASPYFDGVYQRLFGTMPERCAQCSTLGERNKTLWACDRCKTSLYCNKDCQRAHWPEHKAACKTPAATA
jgi:hypothetical protein